jgi:predicted nucleic acid-binding protein
LSLLSKIRQVPNHVFLPDDLKLVIGKGHLSVGRIVTHRLVTDAHLLALARRHGVRLVTLDRGVATMAGHDASDVVLIPVSGT